MRFHTVAHALLGASFAFAQQHEGATVSGNLPQTDGSEISFFKVKNPTGGNASLSLINYQSLAANGERLDNEKVKRGIIVIHGLLRDPWNYENDVGGNHRLFIVDRVLTFSLDAERSQGGQR